jgi:hypothetical protein
MLRSYVAMPSVKEELSRRVFFGTLARASTVIAITATPAPIAEAYDPGSDELRARYRETDEVKAFYRTNGYEF